ncbi:phosphoribosylpyrophosphate synthetase [Chryseobacterium sp. T20]|uniref:phosphoribosylpyrophosphate synthetase n=1 Tax=Chryseobacterium sp. T20 TaxID=3395375 RepID=UPI0039BD2B8C
MSSYDTLSEALNGLNKRGYTIDFNMQSDSIYCKALGESFKPDDFEIVEFYRFEGNSDPADESIVYALRTKSGHQGVLVDAYGLYSDPLTADMVQKLKTH